MSKTKTKNQFNQNSLKAISRPSGLILELLSTGSRWFVPAFPAIRAASCLSYLETSPTLKCCWVYLISFRESECGRCQIILQLGWAAAGIECRAAPAEHGLHAPGRSFKDWWGEILAVAPTRTARFAAAVLLIYVEIRFHCKQLS